MLIGASAIIGVVEHFAQDSVSRMMLAELNCEPLLGLVTLYRFADNLAFAYMLTVRPTVSHLQFERGEHLIRIVAKS